MGRTIGFVLLPVLVAASIAVSGCGGNDSTGGGTTAAAAPTEPAASQAVEVPLAEQNGSGETGTATLESAGDGMTKVTIELSNTPANPQPAHIHSGTCAKLGDVVYALANVENGSSTIDVATTIKDLQAGEFAINVHKSEAAIQDYVACGDIPKS
jgi:hypothetical protein